ncbi:MAG: hypothetical protein EOO20_16015, partial [Chryseobacterium sp.]
MKSELGLETIARNLSKAIASNLDRTGIMYRIFYRVKTQHSINKKVLVKNYIEEGKKLTDLIGIRLTMYFSDDVYLVQQKLMKEPGYDHISKDEVEIDEFRPVRCNLTFKFDEEHQKEVQKIIDKDQNIVDSKYEVQLRTVLSEGWHEVEHDLRYKCKEDWDSHNDLNRNMNGILASLETSEFSMLQVFNELAYRHYKDKNVEAMIKTQYRIRFSDVTIEPELSVYLKDNPEIVKKLHKITRLEVLKKLMHSKYSLPVTINHFIYVLNQSV